MPETRVRLQDGGVFDPREWLRREILWASLMTPYGKQLDGWVDESASQAQHLKTGWGKTTTAEAHHNGNVSRQHLYSLQQNAEADALSFFNQGKNIGGMLSSAAMFRSCVYGFAAGAHVNPLQIQARTVDKALRPSAHERLNDSDAYAECVRLATINNVVPAGTFGVNTRYVRAGRIMTSLAGVEIGSWINQAMQSDTETLPLLTINDGGHPRSAGPRVEMLQPIFQQIVSSPEYTELSL